MNLTAIATALALSVQALSADPLSDYIKSVDDSSDKLKEINRQLVEHNNRMDAMIEKLKVMFSDRLLTTANQVFTNIYTTNVVTGWAITNNCEAQWKSAAGVKRDHIKEMESDGSLTNVINLLITSGKFCAIHGHVWGDHMHVTLEYEPGRIGCRQCHICGLHQSQHATDWK